MRKYFASTAMLAALAAGPVMAEDTDITQTLDSVQDALNEISVQHNNKDVTQAATNVGNTISHDDDSLDDVMQDAMAGPTQDADNKVETTFGAWTRLDQDATNVINQISMENVDLTDGVVPEISTLVQRVDESNQDAYNWADYNRNGVDIDQTATNAANMANLVNIAESVAQTYDDGRQSARNLYGGSTGKGFIDDLDQDATNVVNSLSAGIASEGTTIRQDAEFDDGGEGQFARNYFDFGNGPGDDPALNLAFQDATNVANAITLDDLRGTSVQLAEVRQDARNDAIFVGSGSKSSEPPHRDGDVSELTQTATNASNILTAGSLPDISGSREVKQAFEGTQYGSNNLDGKGGLNTVNQTVANVANQVNQP